MKKVKFFLFLVVAVMLSGCIRETVGPEMPAGNGEEVEVTLAFQLPGASAPLTYALSSTDENYLGTVDILVFREETGSEGTRYIYAYKTHATDIDNRSGGRYKKITARLHTGDPGETFRLVFFANLRSEVDAALEAIPSLLSAHMDEVLAQVRIRQDGKWNAAGSDNFKPLPLWGESAGTFPITAQTTGAEIGTVVLIRSLARIDMGLKLMDGEPRGLDNFKLKDVIVRNAYAEGYAAPLSANYDPAAKRVTAPSVPVSPVLSAPLVYTLNPAGNGLLSEIYLAEVPAPASSADPGAFYLLVGGYYTPEGSVSPNTSDESWYRIDLVGNGSDPVLWLDLLRNHRYSVDITRIDGSGYADAEAAAGAKPMNIRTRITVSGEDNTSQIAYDGQYMLGVSHSEMILSCEAFTAADASNKLTLTTDYPGGWKIDRIETPEGLPVAGWLGINETAGGGSSGSYSRTISVLLEANTTSAPRTGWIYITAGRLSCKVVVTQTTLPHLDLEIRESGVPVTEMVFGSRVGCPVGERQFEVFWSPPSSHVTVSVAAVTSIPFDLGTPVLIASGVITDASGTKTYTVQPQPMTAQEVDPESGNPFLEKITRISFSIDLGAESLSKSILLRQVNYDVVVDNLRQFYYVGGSYNVRVRSNASWIARVGDPDGILTVPDGTQFSGGNNTTGELLGLMLVNDERKAGKTATITFTSPDGKFADHVYTLTATCPVPNSYLVVPGGSVEIPVVKAYEVWSEAMGETLSGSVTCELLWKDAPQVLSSTNILQEIALSTGDQGASSRIRVKAGSLAGNAVVVVRIAGTIRWSWHIWVTDYNPDVSLNSPVTTVPGGSVYRYDNGRITTYFMDRNLGASSGEAADRLKTYGLYYQWGRKDPFPGPADIYSTTPSRTSVFGTGSNPVTLNSTEITPQPAGYYLSYAVKSPGIFLIASAGDWYATSTSQKNNYLWNTVQNAKTYFDPCPRGWRVPICSGNNIYSPWYANDLPLAQLGGSWNGGWDWSSPIYRLGFYPAAGRMVTVNGFEAVTSSGYCWMADASAHSDREANCYHYYDIYNNVMGASFRAHGLPVRCVKE